MAIIHHATLARAKKLGINLQVEFDQISAYDEDGNTLATGPNGKTVLAQAETVMKAYPSALKSTPKAPDPELDEMVENMIDHEDAKEERAPKYATSVVKADYRNRYSQFDDTNGDRMSVLLREALKGGTGDDHLNEPSFNQISRDNGIDPARWAHLNPGMRRMNLGNVLRAKMRKGEDVVIGDFRVEF